jgi:hypothetical protein
MYAMRTRHFHKGNSPQKSPEILVITCSYNEGDDIDLTDNQNKK